MHIPQTELHRHLDASFRTRTLLELCQELGIEGQGTSLAAFESKVLLKQPMRSLGEVLEKFALFQKVFHRPEVLRRLAFECVEDVAAERTQAVEFRYAPSFVAEVHDLDWDACLQAIQAGLAEGVERNPGVDVGLICITTRDYGPEEAAKVADFYLDNLDAFVGFDLAGNEVGFPCRVFEQPLQRLLRSDDRRVNVTVHAGEAAGADNVWEAIELLGAKRIGHGLRSIDDPKLMELLRERDICLEICPTSNWICRCIDVLEAHPIKRLIEAGVPVSINTDDPGLFGNTLADEFAICREVIGMSEAQMQTCFASAHRARFSGRDETGA
ncbi:MAG: adenosine deaminase [Proteobacteria bacterium]|nr:adenosine deaminase [Pseudomonadota bacterium]